MSIQPIDFSNNILSLHRYSKRLIAIIIDIGLCILCTWLAYTLRLEELILFKNLNFFPAIISIVIAIPVFWLFGLYRTIVRNTDYSIILNTLASIFVYGLIYFIIIATYGIEGVPRSIGVLQPMLLFFLHISLRLAFKYLLKKNNTFKKFNDVKNVLIYGAGEAGKQVIVGLENNPEFNVVGFIDDNRQIQNHNLFNQPIYSKSNLKHIIKSKNVKAVFIAIPSIKRIKKKKIIEELNKYKLIVKTLPSFSEIIDGKVTISDIKDFIIEDLLDRDQVEPDTELLKKKINAKTVLVTGAGGTIGSELCRQILKLNPDKLILMELNEFALYKIYEELSLHSEKIKIISILSNAQDQNKLEKIFGFFQVDTVYHAAAYKHVPLVEQNICEAVKNNVFGTLAVVRASINKNVSNLVLVSSDKAVRPTNIMGATKRLAELCLQALYSREKNDNLSFSIVRFGNVLESSGSVIPKFKNQIKNGGPVTLTHKNVSRYFMTITEAAQLVMQAGAMGKKSEVFILDMGKSIKIKDLIYKMIALSGFSVRDEKNLNGEIEIKEIGLRSGEKLYEELLLGENPKTTSHKKIQKASDPFIPYEKLKIDLDNLKIFLDQNNIFKVKQMLEKIVSNYKSNSKIVDHFYEHQKNLKIDLRLSKIINSEENKVIGIKTT